MTTVAASDVRRPMGRDGPLSVGVLGLGMAGGLMVPQLAAHPRTVLAGAADPNELLRRRVANDHGIEVDPDAEALLRRTDIDAVYIATPHQFHREHVELAARHRKHVIVEKPIALALPECDAMIAAAAAAGIVMLVGHTHGCDPAVARLREMTVTGQFGSLAAIAMLNYTDFMYRPRRPEELDTSRGGGIVFNQLPHQVEVARMVAASPVRSVRAALWRLDAARPTEGCSSAFIDFESGAAASMVYSGYDHFDSDEWHDWISSGGRRKSPAHGAARRRLRAVAGGVDEVRMRSERFGYGGDLPVDAPTHQGHFGELVVTYERADVRCTADGLVVYDDDGPRSIAIDPRLTGRASLLDEFCACVLDGSPAVHDGTFARGTLAACLALLRSAQARAEVLV